MAKVRMVNTKFWSDGFVRSLQGGDKLLFLYLITGPLTNIAGCYEITLEQMMFDTGMDKKRVMDGLEKLHKAGKVTFKDDWVLVHNFVKNQTKSESVEKGIENALKQCPDWVKDTLCTQSPHLLTYLNLDLNKKPRPKARFDKRVVEIFEEWKTVLNKKSSLDLKRQQVILSRLDEGLTVEELKLVPHGALKSEFHMGANDRKRKYLEISVLYRDREQVEKFIELSSDSHAKTISTVQIKVVEESQEEKQKRFEAQGYNRVQPFVTVQ